MRVIIICIIILGVAAAYRQVVAGGPQPPILITQKIDESRLFTLAGNTRPEANATNDRGPVPGDFSMEHMLLQLRRSAEQEQTLEKHLDQLQDPKSPNYHHWLTAQELGQRYGLAAQDLATITNWLTAHGFIVNQVYPNGMVIDFSGTAVQVYEAFHTEIHHLDVNGKLQVANMSDPRIPAALAPAVAGVVSLNDFRPHPTSIRRPDYATGTGNQLVVPADLATIYDFNPLFGAGYSGQGQTIVVLEDSDLYSTGDWGTFRNEFGLASAYPKGSLTQIHPEPGIGSNCSDPGVNGDDGEAAIDVEWATAAAPSAAIELASCADTDTTFGGFIALQNLLNDSGTPAAIVSISYLESETSLGAAGNAYINSLYQQAVAEGVSIFVAAGDEGAASSDYGASAATHGIAVSGFASTPYNVAVGGTDFGDTYAGTGNTYWSASNRSTYGSALSYVPEIPWNDSCASELASTFEGFSTTYGSSGFCNSTEGTSFLDVVASSGGPSGCATGAPATSGVVSGTCAGYPKPSWQSVLGNPSDGVRDIPDVSLFAANGVWGHYYVVCYSDLASGGASCSGAPATWSGFGGTSVSTPIMAAIQALANQRSGSRQGNPDPTYYSLAATEYGSSGDPSCSSTLGNGVAASCIFYDVTLGDMDVNCTGTHNCYGPSGTNGVLSTSNTAYQPAFGAATGWDFATGIGTVNANNLVTSFKATTPTPTPKPTPTPNPASISPVCKASDYYGDSHNSNISQLTVSVCSGTSGYVYIASISSNTTAITAPSGWTQIGSTETYGGGSYSTAIYWHRSSGREPSTYTWTSTLLAAGGIAAYTGVVTSGSPVDTYVTNSSESLACDLLGLTTKVNNDYLVGTCGFDSNGLGWNNSMNPEWGVLPGATEDLGNTLADKAGPSAAGATGDITYTVGSDTNYWGGFLVAIEPQTGPTPTPSRTRTPSPSPSPTPPTPTPTQTPTKTPTGPTQTPTKTHTSPTPTPTQTPTKTPTRKASTPTPTPISTPTPTSIIIIGSSPNRVDEFLAFVC